MTSYMSYGLAVGLGQDVEQLLVRAVDRIGPRPGRAAAPRSAREEGEVLLDASDALLVVGHLEVADTRLAAVHARAAELLLVTSSPIAARTRCGPASAIEPRPRTIGTKSASPGCTPYRPRTGP
jgi:hypothetical protein